MLTEEQYKELGKVLCGTRRVPREVLSAAKHLFGKKTKFGEADYDQIEKLGFVKCVECGTWTDCVAKGYRETCEDCVADEKLEKEGDDG